MKIIRGFRKTGGLLIFVAVAWCCFIVEPAAIATMTSPSPADSVMAGYASYYSYECADKPMANGRRFDPEKRTCASWFYKFGTVLEIKSLDTARATEVVVTDRGPNKRFVKGGRIIDLSKRAFEDIDELDKGIIRVVVTVKSVPK
jgi:rare lipoprotein A